MKQFQCSFVTKSYKVNSGTIKMVTYLSFSTCTLCNFKQVQAEVISKKLIIHISYVWEVLTGKCSHAVHQNSCRPTKPCTLKTGLGTAKIVHILCPDYEQELQLQLLVHTSNTEERLHTCEIQLYGISWMAHMYSFFVMEKENYHTLI